MSVDDKINCAELFYGYVFIVVYRCTTYVIQILQLSIKYYDLPDEPTHKHMLPDEAVSSARSFPCNVIVERKGLFSSLS